MQIQIQIKETTMTCLNAQTLSDCPPQGGPDYCLTSQSVHLTLSSSLVWHHNQKHHLQKHHHYQQQQQVNCMLGLLISHLTDCMTEQQRSILGPLVKSVRTNHGRCTVYTRVEVVNMQQSNPSKTCFLEIEHCFVLFTIIIY